MKTVLKVALGVILAIVLLVVGCSALLSSGIDQAEEDQKKKGITLQEFRAVKQGTRQTQVVADLGKPESAQEFESQIPELEDKPSRSSCIYYPEKGQALLEGRSFQLCFDGGKLTGKNVY